MNGRLIERQIAHDLDLCDMGLALSKGAARRKFMKHRKACFQELARMNAEDTELSSMSLDDLARELSN